MLHHHHRSPSRCGGRKKEPRRFTLPPLYATVIQLRGLFACAAQLFLNAAPFAHASLHSAGGRLAIVSGRIGAHGRV
jgi:hypothetical protein